MVRSRWHPEQDTKTKSTQFVIPECNSLWIRFQTQLNESEILSCEESVGRFFWELARFLESTPYDEARKFAYRRAAEQASDLTVSVIMPFFNRLSLTERALESIRSQTHQRMQILIVDDGSTDAVDHFSALAHNDQRVTWIRQENAGPAGARNNALGRVVGDFIAFLDSDDLWEPNKIEVQLREMVANNWAISHTSYIRVWSNGTEERISSASLQRDGLPRMIASCQMCTPSVMARRDVFARRRFPEGMRCGEDVITWLDIATETSIWGIDLPLAKVHVSEQSSAFDIEKSAVGLQNIYNFVRNDPRFESYPEEIGRIGAAAERYSQHAQALAKERAASAQPQICESATPTSPETTAVLSTPEPAPADLTSAPPALITSDPQASARESLPKGPNLKRLLKQAALLIPPVRRYVENHRGLVRELEDTRSRLNGNGKTRIEALASEVAALRAEVDKLLLEAGAKHDNNH
jgi:hypothetical protein